MKEDKSEFNILLVSDIHNQKEQLEKIVSKCKYTNYIPDFCLCSKLLFVLNFVQLLLHCRLMKSC